MSKACVFHLLDTKLAQEYSGTCQEYTGYVKKPGFCHNLKQMLTCKQSDWGTAFREWGILQLYVAVVVAIVAAIIDIVNGEANVVQVTIQCCLQIIFGYIFAHLGWFAVGIYAIILFYMGYACLNIWIQHGKEIIPPEIDVVGPAGEQIGAAHA